MFFEAVFGILEVEIHLARRVVPATCEVHSPAIHWGRQSGTAGPVPEKARGSVHGAADRADLTATSLRRRGSRYQGGTVMQGWRRPECRPWSAVSGGHIARAYLASKL